MASAGIPGMAGFVAEILVLQGSFSVFHSNTRLCSLYWTVYFIILLNRTCFGKLDNNTAYYPQVQLSEPSSSSFSSYHFFLGLQPTWLVRWDNHNCNGCRCPVNTQQLVRSIEPSAIRSEKQNQEIPIS